MAEIPKVLTVDVGGSNVKLLAEGENKRRKFASGPDLDPRQMVEGVLEAAAGWNWQVVTVGIPAPVRGGQPLHEPRNLGRGWVGFDYQAAFGRPVKLINDAAMQALGSYQGGRMLFLGLGTGLGSALVHDGHLVPLELAHMPYRDGSFEQSVGERAMNELGPAAWAERVFDVADILRRGLVADYVVLGGGNVKELGDLPDGVRRGANALAFVGGYRLWQDPAQWSPTS